jgi:hypothetical protein
MIVSVLLWLSLAQEQAESNRLCRYLPKPKNREGAKALSTTGRKEF